MKRNSRIFIPQMIFGVFTLVVAATAMGDYSTTHTVSAVIDTPPNGPNSAFTVKLVISPADVDITAFDIRVGYDNTSATLDSVTNNTGQTDPAYPEYTPRAPVPFNAVPYANEASDVGMSTQAKLVLPQNIAQLNFTTTAAYNDPNDSFYVYLGPYTAGGGQGGLSGGNYLKIPTAYTSIEPPLEASISMWEVY